MSVQYQCQEVKGNAVRATVVVWLLFCIVLTLPNEYHSTASDLAAL